MRDFFTADELLTIATDHRHAGLLPIDVATMDYARAIATSAADIQPAMIESLQRHGLIDAEIIDIAAAAAARCFLSKFLDALGTHPDPTYANMPDPVRTRLAIGRSIGK